MIENVKLSSVEQIIKKQILGYNQRLETLEKNREYYISIKKWKEVGELTSEIDLEQSLKDQVITTLQNVMMLGVEV